MAPGSPGVVPYVGTWIEKSSSTFGMLSLHRVIPYVGTWIEMV